MIRSKWIVLSWLILLVPTLLLGVGAIHLLNNEEDRLLSTREASIQDRLSAIAGNIDLAVAEVQDGLQFTLRTLPRDNLAVQLERWKRSNPLVRNVFILEDGRLIFPDPQQPASDEEEAFIRRYQALFSDHTAWSEPERDVATTPVNVQAKAILDERKELRELATQAPAPAESVSPSGSPFSSAPQSPVLAGQTGWRSWYADDRLHLIGWFAPSGQNVRYGVEIEMMALLSRLLGSFPSSSPEGVSYALLDGNGNIFHQTGPLDITTDSHPIARVAITGLPHWQVTAYGVPGAQTGSDGIFFIGSLLTGSFMAAILLGGSLLLWQARRHQLDAQHKTSFVSNVSHELKTPLTTIRMYAELLGEGRIANPEKQQRYLDTIIKESQRLSRLVGNVLDFSRLTQGRRSYHREEIALDALIGELLDRQRPRFEEAGIEIAWEPEGTVPLLQSDRDAIEQIFLNLLDNALKYAAAGKKILIRLYEADQALHLSVRDFGPGIPPSHRKRIFQSFHRVDDSLTSGTQGAGLGLSIARQLAMGLGGTLTYSPASGGGSCFELILPLERN